MYLFLTFPLDVEPDPPSSTYNETAFTCIEFTCGNRTENHKRVCNLRTAERVKLRRRVTQRAFLTRSDYWRALLRWRIICCIRAKNKVRRSFIAAHHYTLYGYRQGKHTHVSYCTTHGVRRPQTRTTVRVQ